MCGYVLNMYSFVFLVVCAEMSSLFSSYKISTDVTRYEWFISLTRFHIGSVSWTNMKLMWSFVNFRSQLQPLFFPNLGHQVSGSKLGCTATLYALLFVCETTSNLFSFIVFLFWFGEACFSFFVVVSRGWENLEGSIVCTFDPVGLFGNSHLYSEASFFY